MTKQFYLSRKADADLISFFLQQDERVAVLVMAALYAYAKGEKVNIPLHPVTIMEQDKRLNIFISFQEQMVRKTRSKKRQEMIQLVTDFINTIPDGMFAMYCKGILRYMYGHVIYQTEASIYQENTAPTYITPSASTTKSSSVKESSVPVQKPEPIVPPPIEPTYTENYTADTNDDADDDDDDIFDLFESML